MFFLFFFFSLRKLKTEIFNMLDIIIDIYIKKSPIRVFVKEKKLKNREFKSNNTGFTTLRLIYFAFQGF